MKSSACVKSGLGRGFAGALRAGGDEKRRGWRGRIVRESTGRDSWNSGTFEGWDRNLELWKLPGLYDGDPSKVS